MERVYFWWNSRAEESQRSMPEDIYNYYMAPRCVNLTARAHTQRAQHAGLPTQLSATTLSPSLPSSPSLLFSPFHKLVRGVPLLCCASR